MTGTLPSERSFGLSVGGVGLMLGGFGVWQGYSLGPVLLVPAAVLVGLALCFPSALKVPNRVWWWFSRLLGWLNSRILLTAFFAAVLTPVALVMKMYGRNVLRTWRTQTNWRPYPARRADPKHYEHLF